MSHRTQITLTDAQYKRLRRESRRTGMPLAELVRRAVDGTYGAAGSPSASALQSSFGAWSGRDLDGEAYVERLRPGLAERLAE